MKQESVRSVIDVVVDKEITTLSGIVPEEMEKHFRQVGHQKNTYRMETEPGDLLVLELMKSIRKKQWQLMTSHSFVHLSIEKIMESHFYFERVVNPFPSTPPSAAAPIHNEQLHQSQQKATTTTVPADEKKTTQPVETINRIKSDPEVAALILDRSKQQGPYTFTNRQTLASGKSLHIYTFFLFFSTLFFLNSCTFLFLTTHSSKAKIRFHPRQSSGRDTPKDRSRATTPFTPHTLHNNHHNHNQHCSKQHQ